MLLARLRSDEAECHAYEVAAAGDYPIDYTGPCALEVALALES
jgi:hypothetical protein